MRALLVLVAASAPATAEVIELGASVGTTSSTMKQTFGCPPMSTDCVESAEANERRSGIAGSIFARLAIAKPLVVEAQLLYSQKGYERTQPTLHVDYLELPLTVRFDPLRDQLPVRVFVVAGVSPALRVRCRDRGSSINGPYNIACGDDPGFPRMREVNPAWFDLGVVTGAGVGWDSPIGSFEIETRYSTGLIDNGAWGPGGPTTNRAVYLLAAFAYRHR